MVPAPKSTALTSPIDFAADANRGTEAVDAESVAIPFLIILQPMSPIVTAGENKNAKPGRILNTVTGEIVEELIVVPVFYNRRHLIWTPREQGGGFHGALQHSELLELKAMKKLHPNAKKPQVLEDEKGLLYRDTRQHFVLVKNAEGSWSWAMMSMTSTQIKRSKKWMTLLTTFQMKDSNGIPFVPPLFARSWKVTTEKEQKDKNIWWSWVIEPIEVLKDPVVYNTAKNFHAKVGSGDIKVDYQQMKEDAEVDGEPEGNDAKF